MALFTILRRTKLHDIVQLSRDDVFWDLPRRKEYIKRMGFKFHSETESTLTYTRAARSRDPRKSLARETLVITKHPISIDVPQELQHRLRVIAGGPTLLAKFETDDLNGFVEMLARVDRQHLAYHYNGLSYYKHQVHGHENVVEAVEGLLPNEVSSLRAFDVAPDRSTSKHEQEMSPIVFPI